MSRVTDFDDIYAGSRDRLLLQLYAYCGNAGAADDALNEAFITASHHWHRVSSLESVDGWLRQRAVRRLDGRFRSEPPSRPARPSSQNARLLATLGALDPTSRRLLIVRRLDNLDLSAAAREVGLTDGAAEQALARASTYLHSKGVDTTPAGLLAGLSRLADDLSGLEPVPSQVLLRAGARRRYAAAGLVAVAIVAIAAIAGTLAASRPRGADAGASPPSTSTPTTTRSPTVPPPQLSHGYLLTVAQVDRVDSGAGWRMLPATSPPPTTSVYGDGACVQAADNPPPDSSWVRDFATGSATNRSRLRQVLQLAPSKVEAVRAYRQIKAGFALCEGHQLLSYSRVRELGDRSQLIRLIKPGFGGTVTERIVVSQTGPVVTVVSVMSAAGARSALTSTEVVNVAGSAVNEVCSEVKAGCAFPPHKITGQKPPADATADGFLSVVDLPPVPRVLQPWVGTDPERVTDNPSATACDQTTFRGNGGTGVTSRSYVIPQARQLPTLFGLTETRASFSSKEEARAFVADVARRVVSCHARQVNVSVPQSTSFSNRRSDGWVWQFRQKLSNKKVLTFRVALVRSGAMVAEVTFTPVGEYDVPQPKFIAVAERAATRLRD